MGLGDAIMATAYARRAKREHPEAHVVIGNGREQSWSPMFENNPNITTPEAFDPGKAFWVKHCVGSRPYIDYTKTSDRLCYREDHRPEPGDFFATAKDKAEGGSREPGNGFIVIEPHTKGSFSGNKEWPLAHWQAVVDAMQGPQWPRIVQLGAAGKPSLDFVYRVVTPSFRWAVEIISRAALVITTEGAMHHAAAAVGTPAVVLWGARTHPSILGYPEHKNLYTGAGESCGSIAPCDHCRQAMKRITPEMVLEATRGYPG